MLTADCGRSYVVYTSNKVRTHVAHTTHCTDCVCTLQSACTHTHSHSHVTPPSAHARRSWTPPPPPPRAPDGTLDSPGHMNQSIKPSLT